MSGVPARRIKAIELALQTDSQVTFIFSFLSPVKIQNIFMFPVHMGLARLHTAEKLLFHRHHHQGFIHFCG